MKMTSCILLGIVLSSSGADLKESTFTQVINEVKVLAPGATQPKEAKVQDAFRTPDIIRTGPASRAELKAPDETLTRVGANTIFSFEPTGRNIKLEQGSLLFHAPKGKGGGSVKTAGATAAILGTTILVVATPDGGFKVIFLEGSGRVTLANGRTITVREGQMVVVPPGSRTAQLIEIDLGNLVQGAFLVKGFSSELPSWNQILAAIARQKKRGPGGRIDPNLIASLRLDPVTREQGTREPPSPPLPPEIIGEGPGGLSFGK